MTENTKPAKTFLRVFVTRNTEFFLMDLLCVAVRSRNSKAWQRNHPCLNVQLSGLLARTGEGGLRVLERAEEGACLWFACPGGVDVLTTEVERVYRNDARNDETFRLQWSAA